MKSFKIAYRNLLRMKRRTFLTASLIAVGVVFVLLFVSFSGSFKNYMISQITDSMLGHIQIHKKGYVSSLDSLPLDKNLKAKIVKKITEKLQSMPEVVSFSKRLKFGAMISNFTTSTNVRLNGIYPKQEMKTLPLLKNRIKGRVDLKPGEIIIPELIAKGMKLKIGDTVVLVATNAKGSMNAKTLKIAGIVGILSGPGGKDGYIHIQDARELLRADKGEINEIIIRTKNISQVDATTLKLKKWIKTIAKPKLEVHSWKKLTPFINIAKMIDLMSISIQIVLISLVLISILNVMIMSVYERIKEIGTLKAIGTPKSFIVSMFVNEGILLAILGAIIGTALTFVLILLVGDVRFSFGRQDNLLLTPQITVYDVMFVWILVICISIVASIYPSIKAANLKPVEALRS
ncbi:MAG: ABC transporter permease [Desulfonauticus sp.]|nr:ABC transporter permease [Desulfonauticus sp.]